MQTTRIGSVSQQIAYDPTFDGLESDVVGHIKVESGEMASMVVGIYEDGYPQPNFHIEVEPQASVINSSLVRIREAGEYKLTYHFQNFQDKPCSVTVRLCSAK